MSAAGGRWAAWGGTTSDERTRERARDRRGEHLGGRAHLVDLDWVGSGCLEGREQQRQSGIRVDLVDGEAIKNGMRRAVLLATWMDRGGCGLPGDERDVKVSAQEATTAGRELWWGMGARGHLVRDRSPTARSCSGSLDDESLARSRQLGDFGSHANGTGDLGGPFQPVFELSQLSSSSKRQPSPLRLDLKETCWWQFLEFHHVRHKGTG